jgi:hypothetical protein
MSETSEEIHPGLLHHAALDRHFRALLSALETQSADDVAPILEGLCSRIRAHMAVEDVDLARFAEIDPAESAGLLREHRALEEMMDRLAAKAAGHELTARDIYGLRTLFSLHEAREELGFYRLVRSRGAA